MTKFYNISTDNTLGGNSPSDVTVSSQKAVKGYVDNYTPNGVLNSRDDTTVIKTWVGTKAQYDAIATKDDNTVYVTTSNILDDIYPIGSIYLTTASTCPLATLIAGSTWELVSQDRVLQGSSTNHTAGSTIEAGLPNITGSADGICGQNTTDTKGTGAFSGATVVANAAIRGTNAGSLASFPFNASNSSSIYGNSTTVQPPAYVVNVFRRTA